MTTGIARIVKTFIGGATEDISVLSAFAGDEVFVVSKDLDFGKPDKNKTICGMVFEISERGSIDDVAFYLGGRQYVSDNHAVTWHGPYYIGPNDEIWFDIPKYKFFQIKIVDSLPRVQWKLNSVEFYGRISSDGRR